MVNQYNAVAVASEGRKANASATTVLTSPANGGCVGAQSTRAAAVDKPTVVVSLLRVGVAGEFDATLVTSDATMPDRRIAALIDRSSGCQFVAIA